MKVLWIVNLMLPVFAQANGFTASVREGWLTGLYQALKERAGEVELSVAVPAPAGADIEPWQELDGVRWYVFREDLAHPERYDASMEARFAEIYTDFEPDIVHIFGTEFPHARAALTALKGRSCSSIIGIQGFCGGIADAYMAGLPERVQRSATFRDLIKRDSLVRQQKKFEARAENEKISLRLAGNVTGRTDYDRQAAESIHPGVPYYCMNETLRSEFYTGGTWWVNEAVPRKIFMTQGDIPLKGFHHMIEALAMLKRKYADVSLTVAGNSVITGKGGRVPLFLKIGEYGAYQRKLIGKYNLWDSITVAGSLTASQMKEQYLSANVFVCPSVIENSPNSLGEAMLTGMPVVASRTGGIPSMLTDGKEGILVPPEDPKALADAITQVFEEPVIAGMYGENARARALVTHDPETNTVRLFEIYAALVAADRM